MTEVDTVSHQVPLGDGILGWGQRAYGLVFLVLGPGGDITSLEALFIAYTPTTRCVLKPTCTGLRESTDKFAGILPARC